jgi:DNA-directed RNA polymerase specialized sigma24 family protein
MPTQDFTTDRTLIEPLKLTAKEKAQLARTMAAGNLILKALHEKAQPQAKRKYPRYPRRQFRKELFRRLDRLAKARKLSAARARKVEGYVAKPYPYSFTLHGVKITDAEVRPILEVRAIQDLVLAGVSKLIAKLAGGASARRTSSQTEGVRFEDLYNEGVLVAINCVYCYTKPSTKFSTFVTHAIRRMYMNLNRANKPLSHWTNDESALFAKYENTRRAAEQEQGAVTFDELVRMMRIGDKDRVTLQDMLKGVIRQSDLTTSSEDAVEDFSALAVQKVSEKLDPDQREALQKANLDDWEKAVLAAYLEAPAGHTGWRTEVARKHINPLTNKPYSRPAPAIALRRIAAKVQAVYGKNAAA